MNNAHNHRLINNIETKLAQAQSMIKVILDNHNYKDEGLYEPFIDHCDTGNLLWAAGDFCPLFWRGSTVIAIRQE